jgi:AraC-like DNA-binding protein
MVMMIDEDVNARLEAEIGQIATRGQIVRNVGIRGCLQLQNLTRMRLSAPALMFPVVGSKRVFAAQKSYDIRLGEFIAVPADAQFDIKNIPDLKRKQFLGASLTFDADTLTLFNMIYGAEMKNRDLTPRWRVTGSDELSSMIIDWVSHNRRFSSDVTQTRHRLAEILWLLVNQGMAGNILFSQQQSFRARTKHLLALDPGHDWRVSDVSQKLATSESTLRRQLRAENASFRDLLEDTRLERGIDLVVSTDMPIGQIAFDCGYQSQSRFSERFRLRFSMSPTELRATQKQPTGKVIDLQAHRSI